MYNYNNISLFVDDYYFYLVLLKCLEDYGMFVLEDFFLRLLGVR